MKKLVFLLIASLVITEIKPQDDQAFKMVCVPLAAIGLLSILGKGLTVCRMMYYGKSPLGAAWDWIKDKFDALLANPDERQARKWREKVAEKIAELTNLLTQGQNFQNQVVLLQGLLQNQQPPAVGQQLLLNNIILQLTLLLQQQPQLALQQFLTGLLQQVQPLLQQPAQQNQQLILQQLQQQLQQLQQYVLQPQQRLQQPLQQLLQWLQQLVQNQNQPQQQNLNPFNRNQQQNRQLMNQAQPQHGFIINNNNGF